MRRVAIFFRHSCEFDGFLPFQASLVRRVFTILSHIYKCDFFLPLCAISTSGTRFYHFVAFLRVRLIFTILSHFCEYDASFSLSAILRVRLIFTISSHFYGWNALLQFLIHFYECDAFYPFWAIFTSVTLLCYIEPIFTSATHIVTI